MKVHEGLFKCNSKSTSHGLWLGEFRQSLEFSDLVGIELCLLFNSMDKDDIFREQNVKGSVFGIVNLVKYEDSSSLPLPFVHTGL